MIKNGIPNYLISWCKNFLDDRKFYIKINKTMSKEFEINAGVPQGSVLSPLLFSIFINDIEIKNKKNTFYSLLFADDLCTYFIFKRSGSLEKIINKYLKDLEIWLNRWRLKMSTTKCSYVIFSKSTRKTKKFSF